jgi:hypothetical protein
MKKQLRALFILIGFMSISTMLYAAPVQDLSDMATGVTGFTDFVDGLLSAASVVIGLAFLFSALIKYQRYRKGSLEVRLGQIVLLVFLALLLIGIPQVPRFLDKPKGVEVNPKGVVVPSVGRR